MFLQCHLLALGMTSLQICIADKIRGEVIESTETQILSQKKDSDITEYLENIY